MPTNVAELPPEDRTRRDQFLLEMYKQMWGNINRHILVVWQSVSALLGAFAVFALVEKRVVSLDFAAALLVVICAWLVGHLTDCSYWYDRNLAIIANIERQFLRHSDAKLIHPYFLRHRDGRSFLDHLRVQLWLGIAVYFLVIIYHFTERVVPGLGSPLTAFEPERAMPYVISLVAFCLLVAFRRSQQRAYAKFLRDAPGLDVDADETPK